ncbi:MAG TPA: hypothetical protein VFX30_04505 [bacterium]|nr:hypothetical protein [bacterium]
MMMRRTALAAVSMILLCSSAWAIGPRNVTSGGKAVKWPSMPVRLDLESDLDVRGKDVGSLVDEALSEWEGISEADVGFDLHDLGVPVNAGNVCDFFFDSISCPDESNLEDGTNPLVIDEDGTIVADFFGMAAKFTTLGFASIIGSDPSSGAAVKGEAVFNAACLNGVELQPDCGNIGLSFTDDDFTSFIVHEIGHFLGLDHSQVNLDEATDDDDVNDNLITTMYPRFLVGNGANFKTPEKDDRAGLAQLYPSSNFEATTWSINGTAFNASGSKEIQCANIVARNVANPKVDAISALSGDFATPGSANGDFVIVGLTSGATYTLDFEPLDSTATGASGYTPCRASGGELAPPQFASFTSSNTFTESAGTELGVTCQQGDDCVEGSSGGGTGSGSLGGCSLIR